MTMTNAEFWQRTGSSGSGWGILPDGLDAVVKLHASNQAIGCDHRGVTSSKRISQARRQIHYMSCGRYGLYLVNSVVGSEQEKVEC
jgi:hypothetical protein